MNVLDRDVLKTFEHIPVEQTIDKKTFYEKYVSQNKPVLIKGMTAEWKALHWDTAYFKSRETGKKVAIKVGNVSEGKREQMLLSDYVARLEDYEQQLRLGLPAEKPGYLHDIPFFYLFPEYLQDINPFPKDLLPDWYANTWQNYIQFFMGSTGSLTPLHFDTLLTNNLFFQVVGEKKFILIDAEDRNKCYIEGWRWAQFDPQNPDYSKFPKSGSLKIREALLGPGDILFMPGGMLHQVHGLSQSISFNIDWHTAKGAWKGVNTLWQGAPLKNVYYNALLYGGLRLRMPEKVIFSLYKSYLNYVS